MGTLDDESLIQTLDSENMLQALADLPDQIEAAWFHSRSFALPTHYIQATNVVIVGMGASAVAAQLAAALARTGSRKPVTTLEAAELPGFVDSHTLVIGVSYSGKTAETVTAFAEAGRRGAKLIGLSSGGEIGAICRKHRAPHFVIVYGAQSRSAFGYLTIPLLALLERLNFLELDVPDTSVSALAVGLRQHANALLPTVPTVHNAAKQLAEGLSGRLPLLVGSSLTRPAVARWQMQLAQNAKQAALTDELPGGLYSTLEGISFPVNLASQLKIVQLRTAFDDALVSSAHNAYHALAKRHRIDALDILIPGSHTLLEALFGLITLGDYTSYYLALLGGVDPSATPNMIELEQLRAAEGTVAR